VSQLADWQKQQPEELFNILGRVVPLVRSKDWETRMTAAKAIGSILENAAAFDPNSDEPEVDNDGDVKAEVKDESEGTNGVHIKNEDGPELAIKTEDLGSDECLTYDGLDLAEVLKFGRQLLRTGIVDLSVSALTPLERLAHEKKTLPGRLGFLGRHVEDDELLAPSEVLLSPTTPMDGHAGLSRADSMPGQAAANGEESALSSRQLNALKRKRKREAQKAAKGGGGFGDLSLRRAPTTCDSMVDDTPMEGNDSKQKINDYFSLDRPADVNEEAKVVSEFKGVVEIKPEMEGELHVEGSEWPFEKLCDFLKVDLFDMQWEVRHGATIGLREIVRVHGRGAGRQLGKTRRQNDALNKRWLDDLACRILCVVMLDRFSDYSSDTSVAPIREAIGQTLGPVLKYVPDDSVYSIYAALSRLVHQEDLLLEMPIWPVRYGAMIGLRYLVAVRKDLLLGDGDMIDGVISAVMKGLRDNDDDVRSASAGTLIPMAAEFVAMRPHALDAMISIVWDSLSNLGDDLSASTGRIMDLLSALCAFPEVLEVMKVAAAADEERSFAQLVPRLYPFLRHTITSVRLAVQKALLKFVNLDRAMLHGWLDGKLLRLVFQTIVVERDAETLEAALTLWTTLMQCLEESPDYLADEFGLHVEALMQLTLHPIGISRFSIPMNGALFVKPSGGTYASLTSNMVSVLPPRKQPSPEPTERATKRRRKSTKVDDTLPTAQNLTHDVDGPMMQGEVDLVGMDTLLRSRVAAAKAMGLVMATVPAARLNEYHAALAYSLQSPYSSTQMTACVVMDEHAKKRVEAAAANGRPVEPFVLLNNVQSVVDTERMDYYRELVSFMHRLRSLCHQLLVVFHEVGKLSQSKLPTLAPVVQGEPEAGPGAFSMAIAEKVLNEDFDRLKKALAPGQRMVATETLAEARSLALKALEDARTAKEERDVRIRAAAACTLVSMRHLPKKPSPLIKGIMDSIKKEEVGDLQRRSAATIARLVQLFQDSGRRGPADKVVGNLVKFSCVEVAETPEFVNHATKTKAILSMQKEEHHAEHADADKFARESRAARITRRGAKEALEVLAKTYGARLLEAVPILRNSMVAPLERAFGAGDDAPLPAEARDPNDAFGQEVVDAMSLVRTLAPTLDPALHGFVMELVPLVIRALRSELSVFRYMAAKCMATVCSVATVQGMTALVERVLPSMTNPIEVTHRQGAIETVYHLIAVMGDAILPYVIFLIVPVLGRMSDSDHEVRLLATTSFATLVKLVPLEAGIPDPPGLSAELLAGRDRERTFIAQLLDPKKVEPFQIPVAIKAELRSYQQDGVNWLHFLNKYHLHGILCDDMGLGKTLQTLCIVASDHHNRAQEFAQTRNPDMRRLPSLIVCPPTLAGHWQQEIATYAPFLSVTPYVGAPAARTPLKDRLGDTDVVITSYDVCRNDCEVLERYTWNYVVLDEGHLIKNAKTKTSMAVKRLASNHRLILTGTPIQNNVLELWSLFDFLMPGFLGAEKVFHDRFARPIAASRNAKASSKEQEAGALAIESLHKQVLPFLLRRLKEEVLNDLPPKILQNYYCNLSELQCRLHEDFVKRQGRKLQDHAGSADKEAKQHIFQALQYMRKLCNSPALVVKPGHAMYDDTQRLLAKQGTSLDDVAHAPKLAALRDLLVDCGIGVESAGAGGTGGAGDDTLYQPIKPHRALVFCQMKEMLDMVQNKVLKELLPSVSYLRMDGSVEASRRQDIVNKFNSDPSYDVLLLTTSVGGLGLNLTGADTVIFVEHDWNPQKDLQAMDRAHRIGQKKVVNVYRIITRGTLEEKILSLQRFKIDVASTVVNQQNAGLGTMDTDQILDLFNLSDAGPSLISEKGANDGDIDGREEDMVDLETGDVRQPGKKAWLQDLGELWDNKQYEESFDLDGFLQSMK
jgi:TATA-binding protein-associated factor